MTRIEFACQLRANSGSNTAIRRHAERVEAMTDDEFEVHRTNMAARRVQAAPAVARMASELRSLGRR